MCFSVTSPAQDAEVLFDNLSNIGHPQMEPEFIHSENNTFYASKETNFNRQLPYVVTTFDNENAVLSDTVNTIVSPSANANEPSISAAAALSNTSASTRSSYQSTFSELQG